MSVKEILKAVKLAENAMESIPIDSKMKGKKKNKYNRTDMLAEPNCRQLKPWPNPKLEGPHQISRAALNAKMSSRLEYLAKPRIDYNLIYCQTFDRPQKPNVNKDDESISSRIIELSKPTRTFFDESCGKEFKKRKSMNIEQYISFQKNLKKLSTPKQTIPSPIEPIRLKKGVVNEIRLKELSKPVTHSTNINEITYEELYTIKKSVLNYVPSERIKKLSAPKKINEETFMNLNYNPRERLLNSLKYKASDRILELARPLVKIAPKSLDIKADAYKVNQKALKARCSARIVQLAKPIKRGSPALWKSTSKK